MVIGVVLAGSRMQVDEWGDGEEFNSSGEVSGMSG